MCKVGVSLGVEPAVPLAYMISVLYTLSTACDYLNCVFTYVPPVHPTLLFSLQWSVDDRLSIQTDPHLLRLGCGGRQASLLRQLDVVHGHLRRQATQLLLARHRLRHLEQIAASVSYCTVYGPTLIVSCNSYFFPPHTVYQLL